MAQSRKINRINRDDVLLNWYHIVPSIKRSHLNKTRRSSAICAAGGTRAKWKRKRGRTELFIEIHRLSKQSLIVREEKKNNMAFRYPRAPCALSARLQSLRVTQPEVVGPGHPSSFVPSFFSSPFIARGIGEATLRIMGVRAPSCSRVHARDEHRAKDDTLANRPAGSRGAPC